MQVRYGSAKPATAPFAANDYGTGLMACYGVALALLHRRHTGEGQFVDSALAYTATVHAGRGRGRRGNLAPTGGITVRSADGEGTAAARYARISATVRRGKRHPTGNTRARWCSGRRTAVSWSRSEAGQVRGNRAPTGRTRRGRGPAAIGEIGRSAVMMGMTDGLLREKKTWIRAWWLDASGRT